MKNKYTKHITERKLRNPKLPSLEYFSDLYDEGKLAKTTQNNELLNFPSIYISKHYINSSSNKWEKKSSAKT